MAPILEILPPEIISIIIEGLSHNDDTLDEEAFNSNGSSALKACSLTCSALLPYCRRHIFCSVRFYDDKDPTIPHSTRRFVQLITNNPTIANYILEVSYAIMDGEGVHYASVASALDKLTSLQILDLKGWNTSWSRLPSSTVSSLLRLIHLPTINTLKLMFIEDFGLSDIISCKNLRRFDVRSVGFRNFDKSEPSNMSVQPVRLQELTVENASDRADPTPMLEQMTPDGAPVLDFSFLRSVYFVIKEKSDLLWAQEILSRTRCLEKVVIRGGSPSLMESAARFVGQSESILRTLEVFSLISSSFIGEYPSDPLCGICEVLADMASRNRIKKIDILLAIYGRDCPLEDDWGGLQRVLLAPGWPFLRQVNLQIDCWDEKLEGDLKQLPAVQFPLLINNKSFKFKFEVFKA